MKYKCSLLLVFIGVVLLPVIINCVVGLEHPNNRLVAGTPETWIGFYGSYIGGVVTAIIGFLTLYQTSKNNERNLQIAYQKSVVEKLEQTLAQCVRLFDFSRLGTISMYFDHPGKYDDCLQALDSYCHHLTTTANAWGVVYDGNDKNEVKEFQWIYWQCEKQMVSYINEITGLIIKLKKGKSVEEKECIVCDIKDVLAKSKDYQILLQSLFDKSKLWIESERAELRRLQEQRY